MKILQLLKNWYQQWVDFFRMKKIDKISNTLADAQLQRIKERVELKGEIIEYIKNEHKYNVKSDFIPPAIRRQIVDAIYLKYRSRMAATGLVMNYNLQFAK